MKTQQLRKTLLLRIYKLTGGFLKKMHTSPSGFVDDFGDTPRKFNDIFQKRQQLSQNTVERKEQSNQNNLLLPLPNETFPQYNLRIKSFHSIVSHVTKHISEEPKVISTSSNSKNNNIVGKRQEKRKTFLRNRKSKSRNPINIPEKSKLLVSEPANITIKPRKVLNHTFHGAKKFNPR